jgi:hypothetical protein
VQHTAWVGPVTDNLIASHRLLARRLSGEEFIVTLGIDAPALSADGEWTCAVTLGGLFPGRAVPGKDSWHALMLAQNVARQVLQKFVDAGGSLRELETNKTVDLARLFGKRSPQIKLPEA